MKSAKKKWGVHAAYCTVAVRGSDERNSGFRNFRKKAEIWWRSGNSGNSGKNAEIPDFRAYPTQNTHLFNHFGDFLSILAPQWSNIVHGSTEKWTWCQKSLHFWRQKNVWIPQKSKKNSLLILRESIFWVSMKKIKGGGKKAEILSNPEIREKKKTEKPNVEKEFLSSLCNSSILSLYEVKHLPILHISLWKLEQNRT